MTKLEKLEAAVLAVEAAAVAADVRAAAVAADVRAAAVDDEAAINAAYEAWDLYNAAWDAYQAELKKTQEENSNGYDQVQEGDGSTV
jgi:hypothetical protein